MNVNQRDPVRADHRLLARMIDLTFGDKVVVRTKELDWLSRVFSRSGGSWEGIFTGSTDEWTRLKKLIKLAYEKGFLLKA